jgi:hypothetical protein
MLARHSLHDGEFALRSRIRDKKGKRIESLD